MCADLATFHKTRRRPKGSVETFAGKKLQPNDYETVPIDTEDFGSVLLHLGDRARGAFTVSQMSAGRKNMFTVEIYGTKAGVAWNQERPDELWIGQRDRPNQILLKDPALLYPRAAAFADLPGGHSEGYDDTHKQVFKRFYARVADAGGTGRISNIRRWSVGDAVIGEGGGEFEEAGMGGGMSLSTCRRTSRSRSIGVSVPLAALYERIEFPAE